MPEIRCCVEREFSPSFLVQAEALCRLAGWIESEHDVSSLPAALKGSCVLVGAWEGGRLVGMGRALSDGVSDAYIQDLVVDPAFRKQGIGRRLLEMLTGELRARGIEWIALVGEPGTEEFYRQTGWRKEEMFTFWKFPLT